MTPTLSWKEAERDGRIFRMKSVCGNFSITAEKYRDRWRYLCYTRPGHDELPPCLLLGVVLSKEDAVSVCEASVPHETVAA